MEEESKEGFIKSNLPWFLFISVSINLGLISYIVYYQRESQIKLGDLISISSGLISIALAVVAIIYSVSESIKNNVKEQELSKIVSKVNEGVSDTQGILSKVNIGTSNTHGILDRISKQFIDLQDTIEVIKEQYQQEHTMRENENPVKININNSAGFDNVDGENNMNYNLNNDSVLTNSEDDIDIHEVLNEENNIKGLSYIDENHHNKEHMEKRFVNIVCKRGEVFLADLTPVVGGEQGEIRPVVIIQNNVGNRYSPTVVVVVITTKIKKSKLPIHVEISEEDLPVNEGSLILAEQIRTIDKRRLKEKIGVLNENIMRKVNTAVAIELNLSYR